MFTFLEIYGMQACALNALENQMKCFPEQGNIF